MTVREQRVSWPRYVAHWARHEARTLPVRVLGVALLVMAGRPWETVHSAVWAVLFAGAVVFAAWAAPGVDRRPSLASARWTHRLARHRTSVLACGAVAVAGVGETRGWQGGGVAVLLVAYLVASDTWLFGAGSSGAGSSVGRRGVARVWVEGAGAVVGALVVLGAAA
ncbi:hypothetical protein OKJ48_24545, partial [Streptomyces kunmingensis]